MPTGYTAAIGKGITFPQFAMSCARSFGPCITMRDDPADIPIPEEFKPSDWDLKELKKAEVNLGKLEDMTEAEAAEFAKTEYQQQSESRAREIKENRDLMAKYRDMLEKVRQWQPPTPEHVEFKNFMVQQIETVIRFDGREEYYIEHPVALLSGEDWLSKEKAKAAWDIKYHSKENQAEIERVAFSNAWIKSLRESLA